MGMGAPLLIIGASSAKLLHKVGTWMNNVKYLLGVLMLSVAISMLSRIIPAEYTMTLWALLFIGCAVGMHAFSSTTNKIQHASKALGIVLFVYGLMLLLILIQLMI